MKSKAASYVLKPTPDAGTFFPQESPISGSISTAIRDALGVAPQFIARAEALDRPALVQTPEPFTYNFGLFALEFRHREYTTHSRFVSMPIPIAGELRGLQLRADARYVDNSYEINYTVTLHEGDIPEQGYALANLNDAASPGVNRISIYAASESAARNLKPGEVAVPVQHKRETTHGSDRYGRVPTHFAPYINRETLASLISTLSAGSSGMTIGFDPNAATIKYLNFAGEVAVTAGYRPLQVTLNFDDGRVALPDLLGRPTPGELRFVDSEILTNANTTVTQTTQIQATQGTAANLSNQNSQFQKSRPIVTYATRFRNLATGVAGVSLNLLWGSSSEGLDPVAVPPSQIQVDAGQGLITLLASPPSSGYDQVLASYWYSVGEDSLRNPPGAESFSGTLGQAGQTYPVTRNRTNYLTGEAPTLTPINLDPLSSNYYPVYEYYHTPEGQIQFSEELHVYGANPARITVEYDTLALTPRLIIDLNRPIATNLSPSVTSYQLLLNVRSQH